MTISNRTRSALAFAAVAMATLALSTSALAATLTLGSRVLVSENNANFNISVFPGTASYDDSGRGTPVPLTNTLGDGTVLDYNFFHSPGDAMVSYADGGAGRIPLPTVPAANIGGTRLCCRSTDLRQPPYLPCRGHPDS